jgi:hypothetical protein
MDMIVSVHQLVSNALILTGQGEEAEDDKSDAETKPEEVTNN